MVDEGYLTLEEIKAGASAFIPQPGYPADTAAASRAFVANPKHYAAEVDSSPQFALGDVVRCLMAARTGHTRLPGYARGRAGVIHAHHGGHILPDASARGEQRVEHLYTVGFAAPELWPEAEVADDRVYVDLWESYLEPA